MKKKSNSIVILIVTLGTVFVACSKSDSSNTTTTNANCDPNTSYASTIKPLFSASCNLSGCHDGPTAAALNTYQVVHDNASQIRASVASGRMPKGYSLTAAQKTAIFCWIDNGAKNN